jgi:hypothetical protein
MKPNAENHPMAAATTYGKLYDKLEALGFTPRPVELNGRPWYVFENRDLERAMVVLPQRGRDEKVEPFYMNSAVATLRAHDLVPDANPLGI